jgi:hypothetical protein
MHDGPTRAKRAWSGRLQTHACISAARAPLGYIGIGGLEKHARFDREDDGTHRLSPLPDSGLRVGLRQRRM